MKHTYKLALLSLLTLSTQFSQGAEGGESTQQIILRAYPKIPARLKL